MIILVGNGHKMYAKPIFLFSPLSHKCLLTPQSFLTLLCQRLQYHTTSQSRKSWSASSLLQESEMSLLYSKLTLCIYSKLNCNSKIEFLKNLLWITINTVNSAKQQFFSLRRKLSNINSKHILHRDRTGTLQDIISCCLSRIST